MKVEVYTDGSSLQNVKGGYAAILFIDGVQIDTIYGGWPQCTNNQMELMGIIAGMKLLPVIERIYCKNCGVTPFAPTHPEIHVKDLAQCDSPEVCLGYDKWITKLPVYSEATIISDSEYCIKGAEHWLETWKTNGWRTKAKQPVKNQELWQEIDALKKLYTPKFKWVKGHAGNVGNELADALAGAAADLTTQFSAKWEKKP